MNLDWTTFALEILNFLVLVWILQRIFYRPVLDLLDARQARIRAETENARRLEQEASSLRSEYEHRLQEWEQEQNRLRRQLDEDLAQRRNLGMEKVQQALRDEEAKGRAREAAAARARESDLERKISTRIYANAAAMLHRIRSPALTASIIQVLVEDLATLSPAGQEALRGATARLEAGSGAPRVRVTAAHPMDETQVRQVTSALSQAAGRSLAVDVDVDPDLVAGVRIAIGECLLHANLQDELDFFRLQDGQPG